MLNDREFSVWSNHKPKDVFWLEGVFKSRDEAVLYASELAREFGAHTSVVEHDAGKVVRPTEAP